jgi:DNA invertase Pin-like site-specific DNA recombinase
MTNNDEVQLQALLRAAGIQHVDDWDALSPQQFSDAMVLKARIEARSDALAASRRVLLNKGRAKTRERTSADAEVRLARAFIMFDQGKTKASIARALGVGIRTVRRMINEKGRPAGVHGVCPSCRKRED